MKTEVVIVAIWENEEEVFTRPFILSRNNKVLKFKGRKPNKLIIPESLTNRKALALVKSVGSYNCKIITATGK